MPNLSATCRWRRIRPLLIATAGCVALSACDGKATGPADGDDDPGIDSSAVAFIGLSGAPSLGQIYEGQSFVLTAELYDYRHHAVSGVPVTWWSSDTAVATVASSGTVIARTAGSATIWVASGDAKASVALTILAIPVALVQLSESSIVSYAGGSYVLTATVLDPFGHEVNRPVTWQSTAVQVATVDDTGLVSGVATGSAMIIATSEGKADTLTVTVLPRPTANWSQVTDDWRTYQGNPDHTGHVRATLDPVVFGAAWSIVPFQGTTVNPVTAGEGKVFLSTQGYFSRQAVAAVSASTGATLWSHEFGDIHGVHPPAYANGSVYLTTSGHGDSYLWRLDATSAAVRFRVAYGNQWSRYYAPVVIDSTVYMAGGYYDGMYAFSATDGTQRWFFATNQYDQWTPAVRDGLVYAYTGSYHPKVSVVDAATGAQQYEIPDPQFDWGGWSMNIAPVLGSSNNLLATQGGRLLSFDLANRTIGWSVSGGFTGTPALAHGVVYVIRTGQIEARQESNGALLWTWVPPSNSIQGNLIATDNLLFASTTTTTYAIDLTAHQAGWSYPAGGSLALSSAGLLLISTAEGGALQAIRVR